MTALVKLERVRGGDFIVNYNNGLSTKTFTWTGSKNGKNMVLSVPNELFEWLAHSTTTISDGELKLVESQPNVEEIKSNIPDLETYENNSHSREDVIKLLKGNINKMKSELNKVTAQSEKQFIKSIADELNNDENEGLPKGKNDFINEWIKLKSEKE